MCLLLLSFLVGADLLLLCLLMRLRLLGSSCRGLLLITVYLATVMGLSPWDSSLSRLLRRVGCLCSLIGCVLCTCTVSMPLVPSLLPGRSSL